MAVRSFDQILKEVTAKSDPQRKIVLNQVAALPTQQAADEASLEAKRALANEDIITAARRRGTGIALGGIPLGEQAKYATAEYAPAVANLKAGYGERRGTLESALADIGRSDYMSAQDLFGRDQQLEEQRRQFDQTMMFNREQAAQQQRAAAAARAMPTLGPLPGTTPTQSRTSKTDPLQQAAYNDVRTRIDSQGDKELWNDYLATASSAKFGNQRDLLKLQLYRQLRPDLFKTAYAWEKQGGTKLSNNPKF